MKILGIYVKLVSVSIMIFLGCLVNASWQETACVVGKTCAGASDNYKLPYCVTTNTESESVNYVNQCIWPVLTNILSNTGDVVLEKFSKKDVIRQYCLAMYGDSGNGRIYFAKPNNIDGGWDWQQTFDSHQSLFVYALCSSFKSGGKQPFVGGNALIKDVFSGDLVKILNLEQMSDGKDLCSLEGTGFSKCDMSIYATKIYSAVMSDLYKIKYAQVLNVDTSKDFSSLWESKIEDFMTGYSYAKQNVEMYKDLKKYAPKTISILKSNQMYYKNVLDSVKIIDNSMLAEKAEKLGCPIVGNMSGVDFVACALHSSQRKKLASTPSFQTLVYNEILHYRQFILYYHKWLEKNKDLNKSEGSDLTWYSNEQIEATKSVHQDFQDFSMTYPLHVGILVYIERIGDFRSTLSKIITSFYSLSEKLQNVQEPSTSS